MQPYTGRHTAEMVRYRFLSQVRIIIIIIAPGEDSFRKPVEFLLFPDYDVFSPL